MVVCSGGGKVAVVVGGKVAKEYKLEERKEGDVTTFTCCKEDWLMRGDVDIDLLC
jgi:hypothetical protein